MAEASSGSRFTYVSRHRDAVSQSTGAWGLQVWLGFSALGAFGDLEVETEDVEEIEQLPDRERLGAGFEFGQAVLRQGEFGGDVGLGELEGFASRGEGGADLGGVGDEHGGLSVVGYRDGIGNTDILATLIYGSDALDRRELVKDADTFALPDFTTNTPALLGISTTSYLGYKFSASQ